MMRAWRPLVPLWLVFGLFGSLGLVAACERSHEVELAFAEDDRTRDLRGFSCVEEGTNTPLWMRGANQAEQLVTFNLVVDFVDLGGLPDCRSAQLFDWCAENNCSVMSDHRACFPGQVNPQPGQGLDLRQPLEALSDAVVTRDAPDEPLIMRVIATAQSCDDIMAGSALDCALLMGCVHSCPVKLDQLDGDLLLDLDAFNNRCHDAVNLCASPTLRPADACP